MAKTKLPNGSIIKSTITYEAWVPVPLFGGKLFNHGTESIIGGRTSSHISSCKKQDLEYNIIREEQDRLFGNQVISPEYDHWFVERLVGLLNEFYGKEVALLFKDWLAKYTAADLSPKKYGTIASIKQSDLSYAEEIAFISDEVDEDVFNEIKKEVTKEYLSRKDFRVEGKPTKASPTKYDDKSEDEKKVACKPFLYSEGKKILNRMNNEWPLAKRLVMKKVSIQSISLSAEAEHVFPNAMIRCVIVADDIENNKELYNYIKSNNRYEIIVCESDLEAEELYMNSTTDFDLIIGNPPYARTLYAEILDVVLRNNSSAYVVWLAPEGLVTTAKYVSKPTGDANTIVKTRKTTESRFSSYTHCSNKFGDYTLPVTIGIYEYTGDVTSYTYDDAYAELISDPIEKSIRMKINKAVKINCQTEGMNFGYDKDESGKDHAVGKCDPRLPEIIDRMMKEKELPNPKKFYVYTVSCLHYAGRGIAQKYMTKDNYNAQTSLLAFDDANYAQQIFDNINNPKYAWILKLFGDKRNVCYRANNWPESFEACGFTAEEEAWLEANFKGSK